jgi:hypothetical protein
MSRVNVIVNWDMTPCSSIGTTKARKHIPNDTTSHLSTTHSSHSSSHYFTVLSITKGRRSKSHRAGLYKVMCKLLSSCCSLRVGSQKGVSSLISTELRGEESRLLLTSIRCFRVISTNFSIV